GGPEARRPGARLELRVGAEELLAAAGADVGAGGVVVPELARVGRLGSLLAEDLVLQRGEALLPLVVGDVLPLRVRFHGVAAHVPFRPRARAGAMALRGHRPAGHSGRQRA